MKKFHLGTIRIRCGWSEGQIRQFGHPPRMIRTYLVVGHGTLCRRKVALVGHSHIREVDQLGRTEGPTNYLFVQPKVVRGDGWSQAVSHDDRVFSLDLT